MRRRTQRRRSSWRRWKPLLPMLTDRHDVIAVDLPGFGTAPPLADRTPTAAGLADAVEAELDRLGLGRVHVAGNSLGGWIALELATRSRARSVVALSPSGMENAAERVAMLGLLRGRPWRVSGPEAAVEVRDFARAPGFQPTMHATTGATVPSDLREIDVPVSICYGTRDLMIGGITAPRFAAAIPGAKLVPLRGCGHVPMADDPDQVARAIADRTDPPAA